jgi:pilus assembly protein Flp/PilA
MGCKVARADNCAMLKLHRRFLRDESAATAIEYALIASLIALVIVTAVTAIGTKLSIPFAAVSAALK